MVAAGVPDGTWLNVAVTAVSAFIVTWQVPVPEQPPPDQPVNPEPDAGVAFKVTVVPVANEAEQFVPQSIPAGALDYLVMLKEDQKTKITDIQKKLAEDRKAATGDRQKMQELNTKAT